MKIFGFILLIFAQLLTAQENRQIQDSAVISQNVFMSSDPIGTKNPLKASLYSAVIPGLGQVYNEKYWKVPLVWGLIGTGIGFTVHYNNRYHYFRDAFIAELNGEPHDYTGMFDAERLGVIQDDMRRNRDYAIALSILAYALNILDATVDAHLYEIRKDRDLSVEPRAIIHPVTQAPNIGFALKLNLH
ncbi:MAG: DUF5683 domain-containing protein [Flavobacteriaceae bacterium]|nr:DUF5683 domain-containing protein [Flavobacteriaceae bacterium]